MIQNEEHDEWHIPHDLPDHTQHERFPSIRDICSLNTNKVHLVCLCKVYSIVRVFYRLEPRETSMRDRSEFFIVFAMVKCLLSGRGNRLGLVDSAPCDRARNKLVKRLEDNRAVLTHHSMIRDQSRKALDEIEIDVPLDQRIDHRHPDRHSTSSARA